LDPSLVPYDTSDYVLRSIAVAFPAAVMVTVAALVLLVVHRVVVLPALGDRRPGLAHRLVRGTVTCLHVLTAVLLGGLITAAVFPGHIGARLGIGFPLLLVAVTLLVAYLAHLGRISPSGRRAAARPG